MKAQDIGALAPSKTLVSQLITILLPPAIQPCGVLDRALDQILRACAELFENPEDFFLRFRIKVLWKLWIDLVIGFDATQGISFLPTRQKTRISAAAVACDACRSVVVT